MEGREDARALLTTPCKPFSGIGMASFTCLQPHSLISSQQVAFFPASIALEMQNPPKHVRNKPQNKDVSQAEWIQCVNIVQCHGKGPKNWRQYASEFGVSQWRDSLVVVGDDDIASMWRLELGTNEKVQQGAIAVPNAMDRNTGRCHPALTGSPQSQQGISERLQADRNAGEMLCKATQIIQITRRSGPMFIS